MTLTQCAPRWWGDGQRHLGMSFLCPHCCIVRLGIAFANPPGGGAPSPIVTTTARGFTRMPKCIAAHLDELRTFDVPPGFLWHRTGEDFATMSFTPSVDASKSGHWHGSVTNGEIS